LNRVRGLSILVLVKALLCKLATAAAVLCLAMLTGLGGSSPQPARAGSGALFGLFPGANNDTNIGTPSWTESNDYLPAMVSWQGKRNDVVNIYNQINGQGGVDTVVKQYLPHIWDDLGSVPMISLNTNNHTNVQVYQGAADSDIDYYANSVKQWIYGADARGIPAPEDGRRLYIRLDWEVNGDFSPWEPPKNSTTCDNLLTNEQDYVRMWKYFHDRFMADGGFTSSQVEWVYSIYYFDVFNPVYASTLSNCANGASDVVRETYPGDAYVDWVGVDGYAYNSSSPYVSPADTFGPAFARLRGISTRPMSTDEVGVSTHSNGFVDKTPAQKAAWIADYFNYIESQNVRMALWFHNDLGAQNSFHDLAVFCQSNQPEFDPFCTGDSSLTGADGMPYNAYSSYRAAVAGSYFASPSTTNPRLLTDAEFQGT
jgi:hypothetical protein